jgi:hypothetical protein
MTWFLVLVDNLKIPFFVFSVVGLAIAAIVGFATWFENQKLTYGSPQHSDSKDLTMLCLQGGIILAILNCIVLAIPKPDYKKEIQYKDRVVTRTVVKKLPPVKVYSGTRIVYQPSTYQNVYDKCIEAYDGGIGDEELKICHKQAIEAVRETQPKPTVVTREVRLESNYKTLFDNCNDNHDGGIASLPKAQSIAPRNDRIQLCHRLALEARQFRAR